MEFGTAVMERLCQPPLGRFSQLGRQSRQSGCTTLISLSQSTPKASTLRPKLKRPITNDSSRTPSRLVRWRKAPRRSADEMGSVR